MTSPVTQTTPYLNVTPAKYMHPFDETAVIASASLLLPLMVFGIIGNVLTIITISMSKKLKSVFYQFILSLCVSDLVSAIISPLFLYRRTWGYDEWKIPNFFCKLYWAADMWTSYVTALHILLFAILRLISVRWPHEYGRIKKRHAQICIVLTWIFAFIAGFLPFAWWYSAGVRRRNSDDMDARWPACTLDTAWADVYATYSIVAYSFFFYMPLVAISGLTVTIAVLLKLRSRERAVRLKSGPGCGAEDAFKKTARKEKEAMAQLGLIAASFMLGYVPFSAYEISSILSASSTAAEERFWWRFGMAEYICLRISESLNPIFYNLASGKMRNETFTVVGKIYAKLCPCRRKEEEAHVNGDGLFSSTCGRLSNINAVA